MHGTEISLQAWFLGAYLVTTQTPGMSARQLQRQLGMSRYETAFQMLHKLRTGMVRPERDRIGGNWPVEVDEALIGGRLRFCHIVNREAQTLTGFVKDNVRKGAWVRTDGWGGYDSLAPEGYVHDAMVFDGDPERMNAHLPMIHISFSNLKAWLLGTHHSVSKQHLQAYMDEYVFRYNRRFYPMTGFALVLGIGVSAPTYRELYDGIWGHHTRSPRL